MPEETQSLYQVLGVTKEATQSEIKKAYYQLCLKLHPDKNPGDEEAKAKFQSLQKIYAILGDPDKRKGYDETGITDDDLLGSDKFEELRDYFRAMFKRVTEEDIDQFMDKYRGSEEEQKDLLAYFTRFKGNMAKVFEWLMCSDAGLDSHRFMDAIEAAIKSGEVRKTAAFTSWATGVRKQPRPENPLKKRSGTSGGAGGAGNLAMQLAARHKERAAAADAFFDQLAAKYGGGADAAAAGGKRKRKGAAAAPAEPVAEPTDEEFEALQAKLFGKGKKGEEEEDERPAKRGKTSGAKGKGKKGSLIITRDDDDDEEEEEDEPKTRAGLRKLAAEGGKKGGKEQGQKQKQQSKKAKKQEESDDGDVASGSEDDASDSEEEEEEEAKPATRKSPRKAKKAAVPAAAAAAKKQPRAAAAAAAASPKQKKAAGGGKKGGR